MIYLTGTVVTRKTTALVFFFCENAYYQGRKSGWMVFEGIDKHFHPGNRVSDQKTLIWVRLEDNEIKELFVILLDNLLPWYSG